MKKILFIISYSLYIVFVLGLFLHTSAHPQIFHKYTIKYVVLLTGLVILFPLYLWVMWYVFHDSKIKFRKRVYKFKAYQKFLILILLFFLIIVLPIEFYLRAKYYNYESTSYLYTLDNFDPFLQFKLTNKYTTNVDSYGFRGSEITKSKPKNTYRIFILGGSTALNAYTPYEESAPRVLEKLLQKKYPDKKIQVINGGVDGYSSEHSLIEYLFKVRDFQPDMIIMWHGINDWYYSCSPPSRAYGPPQPDYSHFFAADAQMAFSYFKPPPLINIKFLTYDFFIKFMQDNWYSDIFQKLASKYPFQGYYTNATKSKQYDMNSYSSLQSYKRNLQELINATNADNVKLILGDQAFLYSDTLTDSEKSKIVFPVQLCTRPDGKYPSIHSMVNALNIFNNATKTVAQDNNIPFVDLAAEIPKNLDYFTDDVHYTPKANQKIGNVLYQFIIDNNLIQ